MRRNIFPKGWNEDRVRRLISHYESQTESEAVAEDEAAYELEGQSMVEVPNELLPKVRNLITKYQAGKNGGRG